MRRVAVIYTIVAGLAGGFAGLGGCVQQDTHDRLLMTARTKDEQITRLQEELEIAQANLATVRAQARADIEAIQSQVGELASAFDTESRKSDRWLRRVSQFGPLPLELEVALEQLAESHPDQLSFDAASGTLRFASDFAFDLGSAKVKAEAESSIATLAGILNGPNATAIEIQLIGHTDNVPVERDSTRQKHRDNVYLSVHRAIAVREALVEAGVDTARFLVAGYGEFRPLVPNGAKGAPENRRVELLLVPMVKSKAAQETAPQPALPDIPAK